MPVMQISRTVAGKESLHSTMYRRGYTFRLAGEHHPFGP